MFASSSAYFFGEIITTLGNVLSTTYLIALISFIKSTSTITAMLLARRISSYFPSPLLFRIQSILPIGCSIGCADLFLFLNIIGRMFLTGFSSGRVASFTLNFFCLKSSITFAFLRLASANSISIGVLFHIPVTARAPLLITPCTIFRSVFWLSGLSYYYRGLLILILLTNNL